MAHWLSSRNPGSSTILWRRDWWPSAQTCRRFPAPFIWPGLPCKAPTNKMWAQGMTFPSATKLFLEDTFFLPHLFPTLAGCRGLQDPKRWQSHRMKAACTPEAHISIQGKPSVLLRTPTLDYQMRKRIPFSLIKPQTLWELGFKQLPLP